jgi:transposase-like protein
MALKYKKYDLRVKETYVEEYLRLKDETGICQSRYALNHDIPISTFKHWVKQYREFINENPVVPVTQNTGSFIMISEEEKTIGELVDYDPAEKNREIRLRYKDAVLEFQISELREVMEILRSW